MRVSSITYRRHDLLVARSLCTHIHTQAGYHHHQKFTQIIRPHRQHLLFAVHHSHTHSHTLTHSPGCPATPLPPPLLPCVGPSESLGPSQSLHTAVQPSMQTHHITKLIAGSPHAYTRCNSHIAMQPLLCTAGTCLEHNMSCHMDLAMLWVGRVYARPTTMQAHNLACHFANISTGSLHAPDVCFSMLMVTNTHLVWRGSLQCVS